MVVVFNLESVRTLPARKPSLLLTITMYGLHLQSGWLLFLPADIPRNKNKEEENIAKKALLDTWGGGDLLSTGTV